MKNVILERQPDGSYAVPEPDPAPATPKAELKQEITADNLKALGLTDEQIGILQGVKSDRTANMEMSFGGIGSTLDKVTGMEVMSIPIGEAAMGGVIAILLDRLLIARVDPTNKWGSWANLGAAFVTKKFLGKFIGNKTADAAALILTYEAVADWVTQAMNKVLPVKATSSQAFNQSSAVMQANRVVRDYYYSGSGWGG